MSRTTLGNERGGSATVAHVAHAEEWRRLRDELRDRGLTGDPRVRQHLAWAWTQVEIMRFSSLRTLAALKDQGDPGPAASISKMFWSEYARRFDEVAVTLLGPEGTLAGGHWPRAMLASRSHTIWGGTAEIQRNIVAERVLGLPP